jgi:hypothetical protein
MLLVTVVATAKLATANERANQQQTMDMLLLQFGVQRQNATRINVEKGFRDIIRLLYVAPSLCSAVSFSTLKLQAPRQASICQSRIGSRRGQSHRQ